MAKWWLLCFVKWKQHQGAEVTKLTLPSATLQIYVLASPQNCYTGKLWDKYAIVVIHRSTAAILDILGVPGAVAA